jgi:molybdopterin converting factor small subunit
MEYQQKHTAIEQLELALDVIETRDEMFERLNKEFEDYVKADKKEDAVINDKINKLERQNKILSWASILILAAAAFE